MTWFAFANDGHVYNLNGIAEKQLAATFAHGYGTLAEACNKKNKPANAMQASLLALFMGAASSPVGGGVNGVIQVVQVDSNCKQTDTVGPLSNPLTQGVGDAIFGPLKNQNLWIRLAEFAVGAMVFYIGAKGIVSPSGGNVAGQTLKQTAKNAGKMAKGLPIPSAKAAKVVKATKASRVKVRK